MITFLEVFIGAVAVTARLKILNTGVIIICREVLKLSINTSM